MWSAALPIVLLICLGIGLLTGATAPQGKPVTVYAAASLTTVLEELAKHYDGELRLSFASSSSLARQIDAGAPADVYFSANQEWMDYLEDRDRIESTTRSDLLGNSLVIIAPQGEGFPVKTEKGFMFARAFQGRLALGDPDHVPAGMYAKQALRNLGWWAALRDRLAPAPHVRGALVYVERGECSAGIVYATDAAISRRVEIVASLPASLADPIIYPVAAVKGSTEPEVRQLLEFFHSSEAAAVFRRAGFTVLPQKDRRHVRP
jgi:molybdate transport system substrate-binding protein